MQCALMPGLSVRNVMFQMEAYVYLSTPCLRCDKGSCMFRLLQSRHQARKEIFSRYQPRCVAALSPGKRVVLTETGSFESWDGPHQDSDDHSCPFVRKGT